MSRRVITMSLFVALLCGIFVACAPALHPANAPSVQSSASAEDEAGKNAPEGSPEHEAWERRRRATQSALGRAPTTITTGIAQFATVPVIVSGYGTISGGANAQASLAFPESGRISHVFVNVGDRVNVGDTLARLDATTFTAAVAKATAQLAAAHANYDKVVAQTQGDRAQLAIDEAQLRRQQELFKLGIVSQSDVDRARATVASAQALLGVQGGTSESAQAPDVEIAQATIQQAQASLAAAQQDVAYANLAAPFAGVVTARLHNDGESVDSSMPVIQLSSESPPIFTAQLTPDDAQRVRRGDPATVRIQGSDARSDGRIVAINPSQMNEAHSVNVLIRLDSHSSIAFGSGAYGRASITVGETDGLLVPSSAILTDPTTGGTYVFTRSDGHYSAVPVTVKLNLGSNTWIQTPQLHAGSIVIIRGAATLER